MAGDPKTPGKGELTASLSTTAPSAPGTHTGFVPRGTALGRYLVLDFVGEGGMATVYSAYDPELRRRVAIKLLKIGGEDAELARRRMQREAQAMARLSHPNVVPVFDVGAFEGQVFVAMELVEGTTLAGWLSQKPRSRRQILAAFAAAGEGLSAAHAAGLVHRDFKPQNVLIGQDGRPRVTDFGLAVLEGRGSRTSSHSSARGGGAGEVAGTPAYMSPEQLRGEPTDSRTDQFSFCAALWEALQGQLPFGDDADEITRNVLLGKLRAPRRPMERWLLSALVRGLRVRREERFPTLPALLAIITRDRRLAARLLPVGLGLALLTLMLGLGYQQHREATRCARAARAEGASLWGPTQRDRVAQALAAEKDVPAAEVLADLDQRAAQWVELERGACEAVRRGEPASEPLLDCLETWRIEFSVALDALVKPSFATEAGKALLDDLRAPDRCRSAPRPTRPASPELRKAAAEERVLSEQGRFAEAIQRARELIPQARAQGLLGVASSLQADLANAMIESEGPSDEPLEVFRQAIRDADASGEDEQSAEARFALIQALADVYGRPGEAEPLVLDAAAWLQRLGNPPHLELMLSAERGLVASKQGRHDESIASYRRASELCEVLHSSSADRASVEANLGSELTEAGRYAEAEQALEHAVGLLERSSWRRDGDLAVALTNLAIARDNQGKAERGLVALDEALRHLDAAGGQMESSRAWVQVNRASLLEHAGRNDEAGAVLRDVFEHADKLDPPARLRALMSRADWLLGQDRGREALADAEEATRMAATVAVDSLTLLELRFFLAQARWTSGDRVGAVPLATQARAACSKEDPVICAKIDRWLDAHPLPKRTK